MKRRFFKIIFLFSLPSLFLFTLLVIGPVVWGVVVSFTNEALVGPGAKNPKFIGLANYLKLLSDPLFYNSALISFLYVVGSAIVGQAGLGFLLALLTSRRRRIYSKIFILAMIAQSAALISWVTPEVAGGYCWEVYLDARGLFPYLLSKLGLPRVNFLVRYPLLSIILANIWWGTAWSMLLFKSALETIPIELEESAMVDGASSLDKLRYIILPLIKGPALVNLILITIWTYGVFGFPYMLTAGGPLHRSELMTIYAYNTAFKARKIGYAAAISVMMFLMSLALVTIYQFIGRRTRG